MKYILVRLAFCLALAPHSARAAAPQGKKILGLYENALIPEVSPDPIPAKLDTGATTTSLGANNIEIFERDGQKWVRFTPQLPQAAALERPLARMSRIKARAEEEKSGTSVRRPVVVLEIHLGGRKLPVEVNLADRSRFSYVLLIGSRALVDFEALIDPALEFSTGGGRP